MNIAWVYTKGRPEGWTSRPHFGGSEGSMVHYADAFVQLGHKVSIHTPGVEPCWRAGVQWLDADAGLYRRGQDVVIALRFPNTLEEVDAPVRVLYCCDPAIPELPEYANAGYVNLVITISQHQKDRFQAQHPIDESLYFVSNAGVNLADYARTDIEKVRGRCIYCSVPDRGLKYLVEIWPMIVKELPWATLHVTGGFELWGLDVPLSHQPALEELLRMESVPEDGVSYLGVIPREDLIREQLESQVMLLPGNPNSPEMCCISAMECAAAKNALVVRDVGALRERVNQAKSGWILMSTPDWQQGFAAVTVNLLTKQLIDITRRDEKKLEEMQEVAAQDVAQYDYSILAPQWLEQFERIMGENR